MCVVDNDAMLPTTFLRMAAFALLVPASVGATDGWAQLKPGMTRGQTAEVLGRELVASKGRGFEVAIYEGRAEVVFLNGQVVAWTAPASIDAPKSPVDAWQFDQIRRSRIPAQSARRPSETRVDRGAATLPAYRL